MDLEKVFKNLIILNFLLFILVILEATFFQSEEVAIISEQLSYGIFNTEQSILIAVGVGIILLILYLISFFLLYSFKYSGKYLFTFCVISSILFTLVSGPMVTTSLGYTLDWIEGGVEGAILVFLYFSPIQEKFKNTE